MNGEPFKISIHVQSAILVAYMCFSYFTVELSPKFLRLIGKSYRKFSLHILKSVDFMEISIQRRNLHA